MNSPTVPTEQRPIGFWLKLVDRLIDENFERVLGTHEITRRHWQVLNVLEQGGEKVDDIDVRLRPFLDEAELTTQPIIDDFVRRGWAERDDSSIALTPAGEGAFAALADEVAKMRRDLVIGIAPSEYAATCSVLERMAHNLGWHPAG